jgi:hypothetical protein
MKKEDDNPWAFIGQFLVYMILPVLVPAMIFGDNSAVHEILWGRLH